VRHRKEIDVPEKQLVYEELKPDGFPVARDPEALDLLSRWLWFDIVPVPEVGAWPQQIMAIRRTIASCVERLIGDDMAVWLCLYGPFVSDGTLGAVNRLIRDDWCPRFHLPAVQATDGGPGYVEALLCTEWQADSLDLLFGPSEGARSVLPCNCYASLLVVPKAKFMALAGRGVFGVSLHGRVLTDKMRAVLTEANYVIFPNLDFDSLLLGGRKESELDLRRLLEAQGNPR
jgi:hypothetical protein